MLPIQCPHCIRACRCTRLCCKGNHIAHYNAIKLIMMRCDGETDRYARQQWQRNMAHYVHQLAAGDVSVANLVTLPFNHVIAYDYQQKEQLSPPMNPLPQMQRIRYRVKHSVEQLQAMDEGGDALCVDGDNREGGGADETISLPRLLCNQLRHIYRNIRQHFARNTEQCTFFVIDLIDIDREAGGTTIDCHVGYNDDTDTAVTTECISPGRLYWTQ